MENAGDVNVVLEGHADSSGTDEHNQSLAQARAESVRQAPTTNGVQAERLSTVSFGEKESQYLLTMLIGRTL
jgi:outer membrane protein OmpA-like peptidoglycan-associated protein